MFIEAHAVGTTRTQVDPSLKYDVWVTQGREEMINISKDIARTRQSLRERPTDPNSEVKTAQVSAESEKL